jgi:hypothetical protein
MHAHWDIISSAITAFGIIGTGLAYFQYHVSAMLKRRGVRIKAEVEKIELKRSNPSGPHERNNYYWKVTYRYETPDGESLTNTQRLWDSELAKSLHEHDSIEIAHLEDRPAVSDAVSNFEIEIKLYRMASGLLPLISILILLLHTFL